MEGNKDTGIKEVTTAQARLDSYINALPELPSGGYSPNWQRAWVRRDNNSTYRLLPERIYGNTYDLTFVLNFIARKYFIDTVEKLADCDLEIISFKRRDSGRFKDFLEILQAVAKEKLEQKKDEIR